MSEARSIRAATLICLVALCVGFDPDRARSAEVQPVVNSIGMKLVEIPAGEFMMGTHALRSELFRDFPFAQKQLFEGEFPAHRVRITKPFLMGQHEVTLAQFQTFREAANYQIDAETDGKPSSGYLDGINLTQSDKFRPWEPVSWKAEPDHPVVFVSWNDATAFCKWLSEKEQATYRLPTEAEWEYACRAGSKSRYSFGDEPEDLVQYGNVFDFDRIAALYPQLKGKNLKTSYPAGRDGYVWTAPIGSFKPNAFGLYDMHGNAWEWCSDWYVENYYKGSPVDDPKGPAQGAVRAMRGGGFDNVAAQQRNAIRAGADPSTRGAVSGFRIVRQK